MTKKFLKVFDLDTGGNFWNLSNIMAVCNCSQEEAEEIVKRHCRLEGFDETEKQRLLTPDKKLNPYIEEYLRKNKK